MTPDLIIFDCDGVLVDSETITNKVLIANLARYGLDLTLEDSDRLFVGGTIRGVGEKARDMGADLPENWIDEIYAEIYDTLRAGVEPIAGIATLLDRLEDAGIAYCVASNGSEEKMDITLGQTGLAARFEGRRFSAHSLGVAKPDPGLFLAAAKTMGFAPDQAVVVEDSGTGAMAAKAANMRCLGYAAHDDGARLIAQGAEVFDDMAKVPRLIGLE